MEDMNSNRRKRRSLRLDRHHIYPRAWCKRNNVDPDFPGNVIPVRRNKHQAWHILFGVATPDEAIEIIRKEWSLQGNVYPFIRRAMR